MNNNTTHYNEYKGNPYIGTDNVNGVIFMLPIDIKEGFQYRYQDVDTSYMQFNNGIFVKPANYIR